MPTPLAPAWIEHALARREARFLHDVDEGGVERLGDRGRLDEVEAVRNGQRHRLVHDDLLGVAAAREKTADAVADAHLRDLRSDAATTPAASSPRISDSPGGGG